MNTDYGFFHLFRALRSLSENKIKSPFGEAPSEVEEKLLPINYSVLTSLPAHQQRYQPHPFRWECFDLGIAARTECPDYSR
jgi:hypothetical protein